MPLPTITHEQLVQQAQRSRRMANMVKGEAKFRFRVDASNMMKLAARKLKAPKAPPEPKEPQGPKAPKAAAGPHAPKAPRAP
jgi:hypothetical protein